MIKWKSQEQMNSLKMRFAMIRAGLIGIMICLLILCCLSLSGCMQTREVYVELPKEPVICIDTIKTPEDMLTCLNEYAIKY